MWTLYIYIYICMSSLVRSVVEVSLAHRIRGKQPCFNFMDGTMTSCPLQAGDMAFKFTHIGNHVSHFVLLSFAICLHFFLTAYFDPFLALLYHQWVAWGTTTQSLKDSQVA